MFKFPKDNFVFLETNRFDRHNSRSYLFNKPARIVSCYKPEGIKDTCFELEHFLSQGYYAAGFISYEAGFSFEDTLKRLGMDSKFPLLWFGIYRNPLIFSHREKINLFSPRDLLYNLKNLRPDISRKRYIANIEKIKDFIRKGDTYQVNYTFKYKFNFSGSLSGLYEDLKKKQSVSYSAVIKTDDFSILSLSPELFFRKNKNYLEVRPMKGTFDRGRDVGEDRYNMKALKESLKNRSENLMIVDLLRNDLGRISRCGTVKTENLFKVERYETLLQMISVVKSRMKRDIRIYDLLESIFPSGSVTGAPKISTMKIIDSLEKERRRIYTGNIGFFAPDGKAVFNVAIRTLLIDNKTGSGEMGVGSGIVYDSEPYKEFEECKLKADFIRRKEKDFKLIETIRWQPGKGYFLLRKHLDRLSLSAQYFDFKCDKRYIGKRIKDMERQFKDGHDYKLRVLLGRDGKIESSFSRIDGKIDFAKIRFSEKKTSTRDIFLYHKTTNRDLYDREHKKWEKKGYFDIIFTNEKNQITEGAISNIIIKKTRYYYTPPLECGLLNGVYRRYLFKRGELLLKEKILYKKDIESADEVYMVNSVRGMLKVRL